MRIVLGLCFLLISSLGQAESPEFDMLQGGQSSIPAPDMPTSADISAFRDTKSLGPVAMRVLVFPNTQSSNYNHGAIDDASEVEFQSSRPMVLLFQGAPEIKATQFKLQVKDGALTYTDATGKVLSAKQGSIRGSAAIKVVRKNNLLKSHSYEGSFEVRFDAGDIRVVNVVAIEKYLRGVVPSESSPSWPLESLKAQAVAARSYALYYQATAKPGQFHHVDDTARFQVYTGLDHAAASTDQAILETKGEILTYKGKVIVAFFQSYSGGHTSPAQIIFKGNAVPYCQGIEELFTREELRAELPEKSHWIVEWKSTAYTPKALLKLLKASSTFSARFKSFVLTGGLTIEEVDFLEGSETVKTLKLTQGEQEVLLDFTDMRKLFGWQKFQSLHYHVETTDTGSFVFNGRGWGHHVGMSQWGAYMMAKHMNKTYQDILFHYYTDVELEKI